ncbi:MAG: D-aminoacyl-tRNA deacylase [Candidatus Atribacteria bacterium]|uniref:D-aminoacyl-tRNA deacylase n=1 Tax=Thermatribacter velox TaxID=3039681 RepID=A0ABZ2YFV1_9BACT|nr:D-aminoacyl-tRNA deacylase [Candidatus Atribacteria bacterium]MDI3530540.1 D-aminoacyl-tRNA deacylase [Candidatus Atribacteria bacterium]
MRAVIQRVSWSQVVVDGKVVAQIGRGLLVLLGVGKEDNEKDVEFMLRKIPNLRIFEDEEGKMNRSLMEIGGELLLISQFTLYGNCRKGLRPSFEKAASPEQANQLYELLLKMLREQGVKVQNGVFGAHMQVSLCNDGPVTIILDSKERRKGEQ